MAVTASQLIASVEAVGITEAQAEMEALGASNDVTATSFAAVEEAAATGGATLAEVGAAAVEDGSGLDGLAASADAAAAALTTTEEAAASGGAALSAAAEGAAVDSASIDTLASSLAAVTTAAESAAPSLAAIGAAETEAGAGADAAAAGTDALDVSLGGMMGTIAPLIAAIGGLAGAYETLKSAGDFQAEMTSLVTGAGEAESNLKMVSDGILQMAQDTGESTKQLADGMYMIESAGYHGQAGLDVLKAAAEGAKVGSADLGTVADATTTILNDFGSSGVTASNAVNELVATVASGKTHMQDLSGALAQILPTAAAAHVGLTDVMGALATMTAEGVPAANAATYLRQTIIGLEAPSSGAAKALASVGLSTSQVAAEMQKSLPDALKMITDAVGKKFPVGSAAYVQAIKNISGGSKTMQGMLDLTGSHMQTFIDNTKGISGAVKGAGNSIAGWSKVQGDFNTKMDKAKAALEAAAIKIGEKLLPALSQLLDKVTPLISQFTAWILASNGLQKTLTDWAPLIAGVAALIGGILVAAFIAWAIAAASAAIATIAATWPILLIIVAIAALVAIIVLLVQHWGAVTKFLQTAWDGTVKALKSAWDAFTKWISTSLTAAGNWLYDLFIKPWIDAWNGLKAFFTTAWKDIVAIFKGAINTVVGWFEWLYNHNYYFKNLVDFIVNTFNNVKTFIIKLWNDITSFLTKVWNDDVAFAKKLWKQISDVFSKAWNTYIVKPLTAFGESIAKFFTKIWDDDVAFVEKLWKQISGIFSSVWNTYIAKPLGDLWTQISNWFNNLVKSAETWGKNLIQSLINGINSMLGNIGQAASNVAKTIAQFLGFHSPTELGPGSAADQWAPNLIKMFTSGLKAGMPQIQSAFNSLLSPLGGSSGVGYGGSGIPFTPSLGSGNQTIVVQVQSPVYLDSHQLVSNGLGQTVAQQVYRGAGIRMQP